MAATTLQFASHKNDAAFCDYQFRKEPIAQAQGAFKKVTSAVEWSGGAPG